MYLTVDIMGYFFILPFFYDLMGILSANVYVLNLIFNLKVSIAHLIQIL